MKQTDYTSLRPRCVGGGNLLTMEGECPTIPLACVLTSHPKRSVRTQTLVIAYPTIGPNNVIVCYHFFFQVLSSFKILSLTFCLIGMVLFSCQLSEENTPPLFTLLSPQSTGVTFSNDIAETETLNILEYLYMYNGGGVAVGDINNDGLPDIYFTANQQSNILYLNKSQAGLIQFEDITEKAGVSGDTGTDSWTTGVTMADVNQDGWLDIYVCQIHGILGLKGANKLYINNQDGSFSEKAETYGLAAKTYAQQAAFFDYDQDGDLDMYLLNQAVHTPSSYKNADLRQQRDSLAGDRLYQNVDRKFHDVSGKAGIFGGSMGYGLGLGIGDFNNDGFPDIYVSNDFHENDYLYYNQSDGTFRENMVGSMGHNSTFSMGNDIADFNNDGLLDVVSLDMKPFDETILKSSSDVDPYNIYEYKLSYGYFYQYSRNMLHLNQGNLFTDSAVQFSEIGQLSGIAATDWSWSALFADLDNDGLKDLYITNGIPRRPNDLDYVKFTSNETQKADSLGKLGLIATLPEGKVSNKAFKNGGLQFEDVSEAWGLDLNGVSQGAAYADLDNDGDLELIVNNLNEKAGIYENHSRAPSSREPTQNNYLQVSCKGDSLNPWGVGSRITLTTEEGAQMQELYPTKGWLSSMTYELHFGVGSSKNIEKLTVRWSDGKTQTLENIPVNQTIVLNYNDAVPDDDLQKPEGKVFHNITAQSGINFQHQENYFIDFVVEQLIPHFLSTQGPKVAVGEVNRDGMDDFYIGGAKGQTGALYLQQEASPFFKKLSIPAFEQHKLMEDTDAAFFDADNDGDMDLYVVSGGGEPDKGKILQDRLYLNDGNGNFIYVAQSLPNSEFNGACVVPLDLNEDGFSDLFVGGRSVPYHYGLSPDSRVLINNGKGQFGERTQEFMPDAFELGMVTDAVWLEESRTLVVAGEWMPITLFNFSGEGVTKTELPNTAGWWNTLHAADMDDDGDLDLLAGNRGENSDIKASPEKPVNLYAHDFDGNTSTDPVLSYYKQGEEWVYPGLDQLAGQIVKVKKTYPSYKAFAESPFSKIFSQSELEKAVHKQVQSFQSVYIENLGDGNFQVKPLPIEAQFSPIYAFTTADFDGDGHTDVLAAGNFYGNQPSMGRDDASYGLFLRGNGQGTFAAVPSRNSGFSVFGEVRSISLLQSSENPFILVSRNNTTTRLFNYSTR